jgi:hypothetical protein
VIDNRPVALSGQLDNRVANIDRDDTVLRAHDFSSTAPESTFP